MKSVISTSLLTLALSAPAIAYSGSVPSGPGFDYSNLPPSFIFVGKLNPDYPVSLSPQERYKLHRQGLLPPKYLFGNTDPDYKTDGDPLEQGLPTEAHTY